MEPAAFTTRVERCIMLITNQLDASESRGTCGLRSHGAQARGQLLEISFQYTEEKRYGGEYVPTKPVVYPVRVYSNDTLWDLRSAVGKQLGFIPDIVKIIAAGRILGPEQNAKPLKELKLKATGEMLIVQKNRVAGQRFPLTDGKGNLTVAYRNAMIEIFKGYAKNKDGTMSIEDMASYIIACGAGEHNATPARMADIFHKFGDAQTHKKMDHEGFIGFYRDAADERVDAVWNDLTTHGFRWDLRKEEDVLKEERAAMEDKKLISAEQKLLPRYLLSTTNDHFHVLFNSLNLDEHLAQQIWVLVQRLPTNPDLHRKLYELDIVNQKNPEWDDLLDSRSAYKLLYSLQILESLTEPTEETDEEKAQKAEERSVWRKKFLLSGGFQHLYSILVNRKGFIASPTTALRKSCLQLLMKMLYNFIISAMAAGQSTTTLLDQFEKIRLENEAAAKEPDMMAPDVPVAPPLTMDEKAAGDAALAAKMAEGGEPGSMLAEDSIQGGLSAGVGGGGAEGKGSEDDEKKKAEAKEKKEKEQKEKEAKEAKEKAEAEKKKRESLPEFHKLVRQMSTNFASKLLSFVSFPDLQSCLLSIIHGTANNTTLTPEDTTTVEFAINLWVSIVSFQSEQLLPALYKSVSAAAGDVKTTPGSGGAVSPTAAAVGGGELIRVPLFCAVSPRVRKQFASAIYQICSNAKPNGTAAAAAASSASSETPHSYFLAHLLKMIPTDKDNRDCKLECEEYFSVLSKLLGDAMTASASANKSSKEYIALGERLVSQLVSHTSYEQYQGTAGASAADRVDKVLAGIMQLLIVLCSKEESLRTTLANTRDTHAEGGLVKYVFQTCLFGELQPIDEKDAKTAATPGGGATHVRSKQNKPGVPKCKSKPTRGIAFQLLSTICRGPVAAKNYQQLLELVMLQHQTIPKITQFEYNPEKQVISTTGYVGLRNMGSTCYMNSLMQQLYMIPKLRYGMLLPLALDAAATPATAATTTAPAAAADPVMLQRERDESLLWQLQTMFGYLSTSEKQAFDTAKFCHSYKDEKGAPINPRIQQDVQEFFGTLVDRLEKKLKGSAQAGLFKHLFGGQLVNQLICTDPGCKAVREHSEQYLTTSLQVKGRNSLTDSLETYINGEILSGVNCSTCGKKVDTQKRACLGTLANVMVFHLKRFELNYETFQHEKLNNRFEFPFYVNLEPYTKEGLLRRALEAKKKDFPSLNHLAPPKYCIHPQEYYEYQLVGVIIHTGSAQAGHYYSFIKDRNPPKTPAAPAAPAASASAGAGEPPAVWLEFNDNVVRPFDQTKLEEQCFGGDQEVVEKSWSGFESYRTQERAKNAYMLIYERNPKFKKEVAAKLPVTATGSGGGLDVKDGGAAAGPMDKATETALNNLKAMIEEQKKAEAAAAASAPAPAAGAPAAVDVVTGGVPSTVLSRPVTDLIPQPVLKAVAEDNATFLHDRQIFNAHYFRFMNDVVKIASYPDLKEYDPPKDTPNPAMPLVQLAVRFALDTLARAGDNAILPEYLNSLCGQLNGNLPAARWLADYLAQRPAMCSELIMGCREQSIRKAFLALVVHLFKLLGPHEDKFFFEEVKDEPPTDPAMAAAVAVAAAKDAKDNNSSSNKAGQYEIPPLVSGPGMRPRASSLRLMNTFISILNDASKNWMKFEQYWDVYYQFALMGHNQRKALVDRRLISVLGDFMLGEHSPFWDPRKKLPTMGNRMVPPVWLNCVRALNQLIRSCGTDVVPLPPPPAGAASVTAQAQPAAVAPAAAASGTAPAPTSPGAAASSSGGAAPPADAKAGASPSPKAEVVLPPIGTTLSPQSLPNAEGKLLPISDQDKKMVTAPNFYIYSFGPLLVNEQLTEVILHWCYDNEKFSAMMIDMILNGIERSNQITVKAWWDILDPICKVRDRVQQYRLALAMANHKGVLYKIWFYRQRHVPFTFAAMKLLTATLDTNPEWARYAMNLRKEWSWIDPYLQTYITRRHGHIVPPAAEKKERQDVYDRWCQVVVKIGGEVRLQKEGKNQKDGKEGKDQHSPSRRHHPGYGMVRGALGPLGSGWGSDEEYGADDDHDMEAGDGGSPGGSGGGKRARPNGGGEGSSNLSVQGTAIQNPNAQPPAGEGSTALVPVPSGPAPRNQPRDDSALDEMARQRNRMIGPQPAGGDDIGIRVGGGDDGAVMQNMGGSGNGGGGNGGGGGGGGANRVWACKTCTFENTGRITCEMCGDSM